MPFPSKEKKGKLVRPLPDQRGTTNPLGFSKSAPQREMEFQNLSLGSPFASASPPGGKGPTWPKYKAAYIPSYSGKVPDEQIYKPTFDFGDGKGPDKQTSFGQWDGDCIPSYSVEGPDEQTYKPTFDFGDGKGPDKQTSFGQWDGNCIPSYSVEGPDEQTYKPTFDFGDGKNIPSYSVEGPDEQTSTSPKYKKPTFTACKPSFEVRQNIPLSYITIRKKEVEPPGHVFCSKCCTAHHPRSYCPVLPCPTCFNPDHTFPSCPYFTLIPKGAVFDRVNYEIICGCGNMFNEEKWDCSRCNGRPKLVSKYCHICCSWCSQHSSHECPKDKGRAAEYKAIRDKNFSRKCIPYVGYPSVS